MPTSGWVIDLGANRGLFSVWAALTGANVVAVEAQQGFATEISVTVSGATVGVVADDHRWATTSHGAAARPADLSLPQLMSVYHIERVGLLKVDIEGGEFAVFGDNDLHWLEKVDQLALEVHPAFGDAVSLIAKLERNGFTVDLRNNDGEQLTPASDHLEYVYCRRQREGGIASRRRSPGPSPSSTTRS
jgi:hypothetical protein